MLAKRQHVNVEDIQPIIKIAAQFAGSHRLVRNLICGGQHAHIHRGFHLAAQPAQLVVLEHAQQLGLRGNGISPISSSRIVPPSASSKHPVRRSNAPVKAPFSWPKISLSIKVSGIAAQLIATKGLIRGAGSTRCIVRATNSLPVPLAPVISTEAVLGATSSIRRKISCILREVPTQPAERPSIPQPAPRDFKFIAHANREQAFCSIERSRLHVDRLRDVVIGPKPHGLYCAFDRALRRHHDHG